MFWSMSFTMSHSTSASRLYQIVKGVINVAFKNAKVWYKCRKSIQALPGYLAVLD
jgi:hypothetical protein